MFHDVNPERIAFLNANSSLVSLIDGSLIASRARCFARAIRFLMVQCKYQGEFVTLVIVNFDDRVNSSILFLP